MDLPVDELGLDVDALARADVQAVVLTPAHQHPTGVVLAPERRAALTAWLRSNDAIAVVDGYDAECRYDRPAVGALKGLAPVGVAYAGTASKVLAPGLRLGWLVVPPQLLDQVRNEKLLADQGSARIDQLAFAYFLEHGDLDRHVRRMRARYHTRRDRMIEALMTELPDAVVRGIAAGLHVTVELPAADDEDLIREEAARRHIALSTMSDYRPPPTNLPPTLTWVTARPPKPGFARASRNSRRRCERPGSYRHPGRSPGEHTIRRRALGSGDRCEHPRRQYSTPGAAAFLGV